MKGGCIYLGNKDLGIAVLVVSCNHDCCLQRRDKAAMLVVKIIKNFCAEFV